MSNNHSIQDLYWIPVGEPIVPFPDLDSALRDPDGLLAFGGDLSVSRLLLAYRQGIFPWYSSGQPIMWWSPDPRTVLFPDKLKISRSLRKTLNKKPFEITINRAFKQVITACSAPRSDGEGTWITSDMQMAYCQMHEHGHAHSVEAWLDGELVGGLYGIAIGQVFFGESMFSRRSDASKVAFAHFVKWLKSLGYKLIDCQVESDHLVSLGACNIPRHEFARLLKEYCELPMDNAHWQEASLELE